MHRKVAEIFDLCGLDFPVVSGLKINLHELVISSYDWDDHIPDSDRGKWIKCFEVIEKRCDVSWATVETLD